MGHFFLSILREDFLFESLYWKVAFSPLFFSDLVRMASVVLAFPVVEFSVQGSCLCSDEGQSEQPSLFFLPPGGAGREPGISVRLDFCFVWDRLRRRCEIFFNCDF